MRSLRNFFTAEDIFTIAFFITAGAYGGAWLDWGQGMEYRKQIRDTFLSSNPAATFSEAEQAATDAVWKNASLPNNFIATGIGALAGAIAVTLFVAYRHYARAYPDTISTNIQAKLS